MEEKIIIKSERYSIKKIFMWFAIIVVEIGGLCGLFGEGAYYFPFIFLPSLGILLVGGIFCLILKSMEIVVTDKRVYGKTYFGKTVDLPLDSVSSVGSKWKKGIAVATS